QGNKVIFQATPIFRGNELMARGINLQAISLNNNLDFNVYIYNVQPDYVFDYNNGRAKIDRNMVVNQ
ncbi:MAG: DNA/RNA non-specific endonuclease, partial [Lactobacillus johnsonii]|nr:DNA/RNA non-specific endonuclease [Lactobacillus johnsonii]